MLEARSVRIAVATLAVVLALPMLPGCIVGRIEKQMVGANERMDKAIANMETTNVRLAEIETLLVGLQQTNDLLTAVDTQLDRLETMASIDQSLHNLDEHLASLRETIDNIDSTIPFLSLGGDDEEKDGAEEESASATESDH